MYAMMQEIAAQAGNFRGVCPVIGRLNCPALRISLRHRKRSALRRPFFLAQNDTHDGVDNSSSVPRHHETEYVFQGGNKHYGKSGNDSDPPEGL